MRSRDDAWEAGADHRQQSQKLYFESCSRTQELLGALAQPLRKHGVDLKALAAEAWAGVKARRKAEGLDGQTSPPKPS